MSHSDGSSADNDAFAVVTSSPEDLAFRRPGQGVTEMAEELRRAEPVRSAVRRLLGVTAGDGTYRKGGKGEVLVGKRLAKLGHEWRVLHSLPVGDRGTDIDHLAIGPGGVFSLNTKNHAGKKVWIHTDAIKVNGCRHNEYLGASRSEARKATRLLGAACGFPVSVTGVIVVIADELDVKAMPSATPVVARRRIVGWLTSQPRSLTDDTIEMIYAAARRATTWQIASTESG
jgi:hypothetical protein